MRCTLLWIEPLSSRKAEADVRLYREMGKEGVLLKDNPDPPPLRWEKGRGACKLPLIEDDRSLIRVFEARNYPHRRGLTGAALADEGEDFVLRHTEGDVLEGGVLRAGVLL